MSGVGLGLGLGVGFGLGLGFGFGLAPQPCGEQSQCGRPAWTHLPIRLAQAGGRPEPDLALAGRIKAGG